MTPKQILDSFSETLMRDERILSAPERALVASLLQHAKAATAGKPETQEAVRAVIASAVGETVAQRAFAVLGGSIVERILDGSSTSTNDAAVCGLRDIYLSPKVPGQPQPPGTPLQEAPNSVRRPAGPVPPSTPHRRDSSGIRRASHNLPASPVRSPPVQPQPPASDPQHHDFRTERGRSREASSLPAQCVVLDEFLAPQELEELMRFTLEHEADFQHQRSGFAQRRKAESSIMTTARSRVLMDLGKHQDVMLERIKAVLPQVLEPTGHGGVSIAAVEAQVTASNDGDFFHFHSDNGSERVASRHLTFVYFFHREPRQFEGGELRIHDARLEDGDLRQRGQLPDDRAAAKPDRVLPVRTAARDHSGELCVAAFRRQPFHPKRMASPLENSAWLQWMAT